MKPEISVIIRAVIQAAAGWIGVDAAKEGHNLEAVATAATFIATLIWSYWDKQKLKEKVKTDMETTIFRPLQSILLALCLAGSIPILSGCAGTRGQRISYAATDGIGTAADRAYSTFADIMVAKAREAIGPGATATSVSLWVQNHPDWKKSEDIWVRYQIALRAWIQANKGATTGVNTEQFNQALLAVSDEFVSFVNLYK